MYVLKGASELCETCFMLVEDKLHTHIIPDFRRITHARFYSMEASAHRHTHAHTHTHTHGTIVPCWISCRRAGSP